MSLLPEAACRGGSVICVGLRERLQGGKLLGGIERAAAPAIELHAGLYSMGLWKKEGRWTMTPPAVPRMTGRENSLPPSNAEPDSNDIAPALEEETLGEGRGEGRGLVSRASWPDDPRCRARPVLGNEGYMSVFAWP